jgi:phage-related baseplate assembly protein
MNLLAYARGDFLDHLGALTDTSRLPPAPARTTLRFTIGQVLAFPVVIPAGTRATPDGRILFTTSKALQIAAGQTSATVEAVCQKTGAAGNGFVAGQINRLVDPVAYVTAVENVTLTLGGADVESDDHFRTRIRLSPEKYSTAGPGGAYEYWAKSAHQDIIDVAVYSPAPGQVSVRPLMAGGALPSAEVLDLVRAVLSDRTRRPLTDLVAVAEPEPVAYDLAVTWFLAQDQASLAASLTTAVNAAVDAFVLWQKSKLGRDVNPSRLVQVIQAAGAKRVVVTSPAFQVIEAHQVALANTVTVTFGGLEDE